MHTPLATTVLGQGKDLVLIHGWGLRSEVWHPIAMQLSQQYRITLVDLPGFGKSPLPDAEYTLETLLNLLKDSMPNSAIWIGWSLGGLLSTAFALRYPESVEKLMLVSSSPYFMADDDWPGMSLNVFENFEGMLERHYAKTIEQFLQLQMLGVENARRLVRAMMKMLLEGEAPKPAALKGGLKLLFDVDLREQLKTLHCPVTYVFGRLDSIVPIDVADCLPNYCPAAERVVLPKAAHAPFLSHEAEFMAHLHKFLNDRLESS